jgi:predicted transcriptional regulator
MKSVFLDLQGNDFTEFQRFSKERKEIKENLKNSPENGKILKENLLYLEEFAIPQIKNINKLKVIIA